MRRIFREIVDAHSGAHWVLLRDGIHPGGPGTLLPATSESELRESDKPDVSRRADAPCIHFGEKLIIEDRTETAEAFLEGVAMEAATVGSALRVRLKIGGKVVRTKALAPGRAALAADVGERK
jgi:hypothetical protein